MAAGGGSGGNPGSGAGTSSHDVGGTSSQNAGGPGGSGRNDRAGSGTGGSHAAPRTVQTTASLYPASERIPEGVSGGTLGLSGSDLALIAIGFALLVLAGLLTGRLARSSTPPSDVQRSVG
ncbi:MAG TPA: hypothetical protein VMB05_13965 [Solirubrobacteraceae bacterium]|nr:hypothetical protein [Solirubrobacteraceae bacterium]